MQDPTIKQAQAELAKITDEFNARLTEFEQRYGVKFAYAAFIDHANDGTVQVRINATI